MNQRNFKNPMPQYATWCEIDLAAVRFNLKQIRKLTERNQFNLRSSDGKKAVGTNGIGIMPVIKADAYGHGIMEIGRVLSEENVDILAVSDINEGISLRDQGIKQPIMLFESTLPEHIPFICEYGLTPSICTLDFAKRLNAYAEKLNKTVRVHIELDTGMGRLGIWHEEAFEFIQEIRKCSQLIIEGIFTHFPSADSDKKFTRDQIKNIHDLVLRLDKTGLIIRYVYASNSMGLLGYKTDIFNLFRPGLMIYGLYPDKKVKDVIQLKPVLSVKAKVIFVKDIEKGRSISYGRTFVAKKKMKVATIPIGYNDGYLRDFSNKSHVLIDGVRCPVLGNVTMDQIMVDVSRVKQVKIGDVATIMGAEKDEMISADELARYANTINYEIICHLGNRLPRVYSNE
ncbi:MAG: alanine racemase [Candidatus Omnitrophica bacterium]|nr:alanine racemase [Candidatus Omnitrophota bacterium]